MDLFTDFELKIQDINRETDRYPDRFLHDICDANYVERCGIRDNPPLCALPLPASDKWLLMYMYRGVPDYDRNEAADLPPYLKLDGLLTLDHAYVPLSYVPLLNRTIAEFLAKSYMGRNLKLDLLNSDKPAEICSCRSEFYATPRMFTIVGSSGIGKSEAVSYILSQYPKAVRHRFKNLECIQIFVIYLTGMAGNLRELLNSFFEEVDRILGTGPVWSKKKNRQIGEACTLMKTLIRKYMIGLIIIDETEYLSFTGQSSIENLISISAETGLQHRPDRQLGLV